MEITSANIAVAKASPMAMLVFSKSRKSILLWTQREDHWSICEQLW